MSDGEDGLIALGALEQGELYIIMSALYTNLYGGQPIHMRGWETEELIRWFQEAYTYDPSSENWVCNVAIH